MGAYAQVPGTDDLLAYLGLDSAQYDQAQAGHALDAALAAQAADCVTDPYTAPLREAALRRAAAILAGRGSPLGQTDMGAYGSFPLLRYDAHVERLEADRRRGGFA